MRKFYNKRKYNVFISTTYLDYLIYNDGEIERLLEIDDKLAIEIYEFLLFNNKHDYNWKCLEKIIAVKKNYIKIFANRFIDENIDADGEINFVFKEECCDKFLNECFTICLSADVYYPPFNLCRLISNYIDNVNLQNWIERYIESNYRNEKAMDILFSALAQVRADYRNKYLLQYYKLGNSKLIIRCALLHKVQSFSDARSHYNSLINELEELKKAFMTWDNVEIINFIDILIDDHRNSIRLDEIDKMVEYENQDVFRELRDMDYKTEISSKDAFELYVHDYEFKKFINSGYASYKNGSYVTPNEEPVKFVDILKDRKILTIRVKEDSSYEEYLSSMNSIINKFEDDSNVTLDQCLISLFNERD